MSNNRKSDKSQNSSLNSYIQKLLVSHPLREPVLRQVIQALPLPRGSRGLDAGCGIGQPMLLLAEAVGLSGHVTGLDICPEFLAKAREIVQEAGLSEQISFKEGNVNKLPFGDNTFDWLWSADCVGYPAQEPLSLMKELKRVVKPGGTVAILIYSSQQLLPGFPQLEARLNATSSGLAPFTKGMKPELHSLRALGWYHNAGFKDVKAHTFVGDAHAPLSDDIHKALMALIEMRWIEPESELAEQDHHQYQRLCRPESADFILNLPDYYAFFTYSLFSGKVAE